MFKFTTALALFVVFSDTVLAGKKKRKKGMMGMMGGWVFGGETQVLDCDATGESFSCGSPRLADDVDGVFTCRTKYSGHNRTHCVDPDEASINDECGCCDGDCPTDCPCPCAGDTGYWLDVTSPFASDEGASQVLACVPQLNALTRVAQGHASCLEVCELPTN